ncbi:MAG: hypothetical protein P8K76_12965 [Candidatus Binatia bacterium]|nr:hypothetical protein [Candidatus Binatia bacterium]MDG2010679.1 hypothetical protein [Candidatus Binatia bacterium]
MWVEDNAADPLCVMIFNGGQANNQDYQTVTLWGPKQGSAPTATAVQSYREPPGACEPDTMTSTFVAVAEIGTYRPPFRIDAPAPAP